MEVLFQPLPRINKGVADAAFTSRNFDPKNKWYGAKEKLKFAEKQETIFTKFRPK
jgi:hypothetical protein